MAPGRSAWADLLDQACRGEGLGVAYQPVVDTARGTVVGYEALARFPGFDEKSPEVWFSAARSEDRAAELEAAALRIALKAREMLPTNCFLTVNVSPDLLASDEIRRIWRAQGDLSGLVIELTEQVPIDSYGHLAPDLDRLRAAGALIAVDDAGAGYAGLRHLLSLRPSIIKIDRELVRDVDSDEAKRALIEMLGTFAGRVDAWILAEGIETAEELETVAALGVPLVQGYYLARPSAPWASIPLETAHRLAARDRTGRGNAVRHIVEPAFTVSTVAAAADAFAVDARLQFVVLLSDDRRPVCILDPFAAANGWTAPGLRLNLDTPIAAALARAVTRPQEHRFEPMPVTDNAGRFAGIVRMERLITALAGSESSASA
ncbi:EAL domain-containing protein [Arthrobacter sp. NPDC055138]